MITLRDDQLTAVQDLRASLRAYQSTLLNASPGWGKTVLAAFMAAEATSKNRRITFAIHRKELARQTAKTFAQFGIRYGIVMGGRQSDPFARVQIVLRQSMKSRRGLLKTDLFIPDEAHLWASDISVEMIDEAKQNGAYIVPLTGSPGLANGSGLGCIADNIVDGPSPAWLIERGFLAQYRAFAPVTPDLSGLHLRQGEFITSELDERFDKPSVIGDRVSAYKRFAYGKRHVGYCYSRKNGILTTAEFNANGIPAAYMDGDTPDDERIRIIGEFADRKIWVLINVALLAEGFDLSSQVGRNVPIESVGLYSPCNSLPRAIQMMMRPMRPQPGAAILLDHVGIFKTHGLPDDERTWTLESGSKKKAGESALATTTCSGCLASYRPHVPKCPYCQTVRDVVGRTVEEVAGDIEEIDKEAVRQAKKDELRRTRDLPGLVELAKNNGHKPGWIVHLMKARGQTISYDQVVRAMRQTA